MTAYDLVTAMKRSTSFFYSVSLGSIHPALQRLLRGGLVTRTEEVEKGRLRKCYTITGAGEQAFLAWLSSPWDVGKVKDDAILRLFFLGALRCRERRKLLAGYLDSVRAQLTALDALYAESQARLREVPAELRGVAEYQLHTLRFGRDYYRFVVRWFGELESS